MAGDTEPRSHVLSLVAQGVSVGGTVAFSVAVLINVLVFNTWGLNFLQLATLTDVAMSALSVLTVASPLIAAVALGSCMGLLPFKPVRRGTVAFLAMAAMLVSLIGAIVLMVKVPLTVWTVVPLSFSYFCSAAHIALKSGPQKPNAWIFSAVVMVLFTLVSMGIVARNGFIGDAQLPTSSCWTGSIEVLWVGERAVVGRCRSDGNLRVVLNPESETMFATAGASTPSMQQSLVRPGR